MKNLIKVIAVMLFAVLFLYSSVYAQVRPGVISVTPYIGGHVFDYDQRLDSAPAYGLRLGYDFTPYLGLEASGDFIRTKYDRAIAVDNTSNGGNYRLEGILHLLPQYRLVPFLAAGVGGQHIDYPKDMANSRAFVADYGGGLKLFLTDWFALRADVRHMYVFDEAKKNFSYNLGFSFLFGGKKAVPKREEVSMYAPMSVNATSISDSQINVSWKEAVGASGYRVYRDNVYLTSTTVAALMDSGLKASTEYCYHITATDSTGKESEKSDRACATTLPVPVSVLEAPTGVVALPLSDSQINVSWKGTPEAAGYKIYRDGVYLTSSKTPSLADMGLKADTSYCYTVAAVDRDGRESPVSLEGCAKTIPLVLEEKKKEAQAAAEAAAAVHKEMMDKGRARINIEFDFDKADIKPQYHNELKKFADVLRNHPELQVVIEGHTDNRGTKQYNLDLSLRRAENVRNYMIKHFGVKPSGITSKGYGMSKPIADNKTAAGRKKNRRVEAVVDYTISK